MKRTVINRMAEFIHDLSYEKLPYEVKEKAKICLFNGLGIGLACKSISYGQVASRIVEKEEQNSKVSGATLFIGGRRVPVLGASFANSVMLHGRAQEDTLGSTHAGTIIIPAVLALAEDRGYNGWKVLEALVAGYEISGILDKAIASHSTPRGFRASPIFGIMGAAAASSKILGLSINEIESALGFAAGFAGGTLESFSAGTTEWRFQVGVASKNGILSALIAKEGERAAPTAIEGNAGFLKAFAGTIEPAKVIEERLGKEWEVINAGFKPYPVCYFNQTPVMAMLDLVKGENIDYRDVSSVEIRVCSYEYHYPGMNFRGPFESVSATLMSTPFCAALALVDKEVTLEGLYRFNDEKILEMIKKINHMPDDDLSPNSCIIEIVTKDGKKHRKEMIVEPDFYNFSWDQDLELIKRVGAEVGLPLSRVEELKNAVEKLDESPGVEEIVNIMVK